MCQFGSKEWANVRASSNTETGTYNWACILDHYFDILAALKDGDSCRPYRGEQAFSLAVCPTARILRAATTSAW